MATLAPASADAKSLFEAHYPRIRSIVWQRCWTDERRQNALAWAWHLFPRYLRRAECPRQVAKAAAIYACRKRRTFGRPPRQRYQDALDHVDSVPDLDPATCERQNCVDLGWTIEDMPVGIRIVALPLSHGLNRTETAALLGVSTKTVQRRCDEIAEWIAARK